MLLRLAPVEENLPALPTRAVLPFHLVEKTVDALSNLFQ